MDLRNLKTFISVAELASFTRAAEQLGFLNPQYPFRSSSWSGSWVPACLSAPVMP